MKTRVKNALQWAIFAIIIISGAMSIILIFN